MADTPQNVLGLLSRIKVLDIQSWWFTVLVALTLVFALGFVFWESANLVSDPIATANADLSNLFSENPNNALADGDFLDLRDPACAKSFSLQTAKRIFVEMSRNCEYSIYVTSGQVRVNFLNSTKGTLDIAPGRTWSAHDFWSIRPLTTKADVKLEPTP